MKWYPDDEDEPDGDASANATSAIDLHVEVAERSWRWRAEIHGDEEPFVLLEGFGDSTEDAKATAEEVLRRWLATQAAELDR